MKLIVLGMRSYDFTSKEGKRIVGCKLHYIDQRESNGGYIPISINADMDIKESISDLPGLYDVEFKHSASFKGEPYVKVKKIVFDRPVDFDLE